MKKREVIGELGTLAFSGRQRKAFRERELWLEWAERYPHLFDELDVELARNQAPLGYHYFEWLAAIVINATTGLNSLVSKYEFPRHKRKQAIVRRCVPDAVYSLIEDRERFGRVQCPDLFVFDPEGTEWFFCEVKGPRDRLRAHQRSYFEALAEAAGQAVHLLRFREMAI